jgi:hypothetical protein
MKRIAQLLIPVVLVALAADASLRARYSYCVNHDADVSETCTGRNRSDEWREYITAGIWDNYDPETGFDNVADDDLGGFDNASHITAAYWIDSVNEPKSVALRKDGALVEGIMNPNTDLRDDNYQVAYDGYIVYLAGHVNIEQAGTYEFEIDGNDGFLMWVDANQDGEIKLDGEGENVGGEDNGWAWAWSGDQPVSQSFTFSQTGYTKVLLWHWDWGEVSHAIVKWTTPDGIKQVIPASAFGKRRSFGAPMASVTSVKVDGIEQTNWSYVSPQECAEVTFTASASNMMDQTPTYVWDFGDGSTMETTDATVTHKFKYSDASPLYQVSVSAKRGTTLGPASADAVLVWPTNANVPGESCPGQTSVLSAAVSKGHSVFSINGADMYLPATAKGAKIVVNDVAGRTVYSAPVSATHINLRNFGLSSGYYMVSLVSKGVTMQSAPVMLNAR